MLRDALIEAHRVGIVRFQLRSRPTLGALLPGPSAIAIETLRPFEEVRDPNGLEIPSPSKKSAEVKMARDPDRPDVVGRLGPRGTSQHVPQGPREAARVAQAIQPQGAGAGAARAENVVDLMEALRKSVGQARGKPRRAAARRSAGAA